MVLELNASNEVIHAVVNGPGMDQPIERIGFIDGTARQRQVFHADGLGSIAALTDENGAPIQSTTYAAFGGIRARNGSDLNRVTYTAREAFGDSLGFYYYRNRILDPNTGRFTSEDPLGFIDGPNRYEYVFNNPVIYYDPHGEAGALVITWGAAFLEPSPFGECLAVGATVMYVLEMSQGKGERGHAAKPEGTPDAWKHRKPHPDDPGKIIEKDPHTGKKIIKK